MARIRSIHPGLFTDEAFMTATPMARLLFMGLWTEAWDDGVFEWKPIVLKARLFPADSCDVAALLDELAGLNMVKRVERGKSYGMIRNFRWFQRPKKPNRSGIAETQDIDFLGPEHSAFGASSEPVRNQFGTSSENSPQMKDGGGRKKEKKETSSLRSDVEKNSSASIETPPIEKPEKPKAGKPKIDRSDMLIDAGVSHEEVRDWLPIRKAKGVGPITETVAKNLIRNSEDCGISPSDAVRFCIDRGWAGFTVQYFQNANGGRNGPRAPPGFTPPKRGSAAILESLNRISNDVTDHPAIAFSPSLSLPGPGQRQP